MKFTYSEGATFCLGQRRFGHNLGTSLSEGMLSSRVLGCLSVSISGKNLEQEMCDVQAIAARSSDDCVSDLLHS